MAVQFTFTLEDAAAELLVDLIHTKINDALDFASGPQASPEDRLWFVRHADYLRGLHATVVSGSSRVKVEKDP